MPIIFWCVLVLMLIVSIGFITFPWFFYSKKDLKDERQSINLVNYQENVRQLTEELSGQIITPQQFQYAETELQRNLLLDSAESDSVQINNNVKNVRNWTLLFLIIFLPVFTFWFYLAGNSEPQVAAWFATKQEAAAVEKMRSQFSPVQLVTILQQHLQQDPNSAKGWYLLGRLLISQNKIAPAVAAFAKANALSPKTPDIMFQYAQALYLLNHRLQGESETLLNQILVLQPENPLVINLLAVAAFQQKNYPLAIQNWEKLLPYFDLQSENGRTLLAAIATAQRELAKQRKPK